MTDQLSHSAHLSASTDREVRGCFTPSQQERKPASALNTIFLAERGIEGECLPL